MPNVNELNENKEENQEEHDVLLPMDQLPATSSSRIMKFLVGALAIGSAAAGIGVIARSINRGSNNPSEKNPATKLPTFSPPTFAPTVEPTVYPTFAPTLEPTAAPTWPPIPTLAPTAACDSIDSCVNKLLTGNYWDPDYEVSREKLSKLIGSPASDVVLEQIFTAMASQCSKDSHGLTSENYAQTVREIVENNYFNLTTNKNIERVLTEYKDTEYSLSSSSDELNDLFKKIAPEVVAKNDFSSFLLQQKSIRILIDDAPNFGHQTANLHLINRLRAMNYQGEIELIYGGWYEENDLALPDKIALLFNLPHNVAEILQKDGVYYDEKLKITFKDSIKFKNEVEQGLVKPIALGLSAATDDDPRSIFCQANNNYADVLQVGAFVHFDSYTREFGGGNTQVYLPEHTKINLVGSKCQSLIAPTPSYADAKNFLANDSVGQDFAKNQPALMKLIELADSQAINLWPAYGRSIKNTRAFSQLIVGARYAQEKGGEIFNRPLVLAHFSTMSEKIKTDLLAAKSDLGVVRIIDLADADAEQRMAELTSGDILIVNLGKLPNIVFDGLFAQTGPNIWPRVREGASSLLATLLTGLPHIHYAVSENMFGAWDINLAAAPLELQKRLKTLQSALTECGYESCPDYSLAEVKNILGSFIIDAQNPESDVANFFRKIKADALLPENDRYAIGLQVAAWAVNCNAAEISAVLNQGAFGQRNVTEVGCLLPQDQEESNYTSGFRFT